MLKTDFQLRQKNIESILDAAGKEYEYSKSISPESTRQKEEILNNVARIRGLNAKAYKKEESIFRKPYTPPLKIRSRNYIPDFKLNPHKWKKYSLDDVTSDQISDTSNTNTAFGFLKSLERRNTRLGMDVDYQFNKNNKHVFKTRGLFVAENKPIRDEANKGTFIGNKLIMPEYVVGSKPHRKEKHQLNTSDRQPLDCKQVTLNHLNEFEDEE